MTFISVPSILAATKYNEFLIDHDATVQSQSRGIKNNYVSALADVLRAHQLENDLEIHLLHRHFLLQEGEAMIHTEIICPLVDIKDGGLPTFSVDIAKAMKCPKAANYHLHPIMWYCAGNNELIPYEYAIASESLSQQRAAVRISSEKLSAFAKEFSALVWEGGLQNLISLKDKSCLAGAEYVAPEFRALFRVPPSIVTLQPGSGVVETGWTINNCSTRSPLTEMNNAITPISLSTDTSPDIPFPEPTDGHVTKTKQTAGGTVATHHVTQRYGEYAFNALEIAPAYTERMWAAVELATIEDWYPIAPIATTVY